MSKGLSDGKIVAEKEVVRLSRAFGKSFDETARAFESEGYRVVRDFCPTSAETCDEDTFASYSFRSLGELVALEASRSIEAAKARSAKAGKPITLPKIEGCPF